GYTEMEVGYAGVIDEHRDFMRLLRKENLPVSLASHTRAYAKEDEWRGEIDRNIDAGAQILTLVGFASEGGTATTPWLPKEAVPEPVSKCVEYARSQGVAATFGLADMVRTQLKYTVSCYAAAAAAGADRLYVYDGQGAATPDAVAYL